MAAAGQLPQSRGAGAEERPVYQITADRAAADGEQIYQAQCASCHQAGGEGIPGTFPPLIDTPWVTGDKGRLIRILLHGMNGAVEVKGQAYNGVMPPWEQVLNDEEIAQVATHMRQSWGNEASEITEAYVARVREATKGRSEPWKAEELNREMNKDSSQAAGAEMPLSEKANAPEEGEAAQASGAASPPPADEAEYYRMVSLPVPEDIRMEVGGLAMMPGGNLAVSTRRGNVWLIDNPTMVESERPQFKRFASGLNDPLGLAYDDGVLYTSQRGELTRLVDQNGDNRADRYEAVATWPLSKSYHGFNFGPVVLPNGDLWITFNLDAVGDGMTSPVKWRGWTATVTPDGEMTPLAAGLRSPSGLGLNVEGDLFYAANQGGWTASGRVTHVEKGDFMGHPASLRWTNLPGVPSSLEGLTPEEVPDVGEPMHEAAQSILALKMPTVWIPHGTLGTSTTDILVDTTDGAFGPFTGQLFVGDQGNAIINRVFLEKVNGQYQGAVFPFREGFASGVFRLAWGRGGALFVGMTDRGWPASTGSNAKRGGLQRLVWTGKVPFEIKEIQARPDGFKLVFTKPVDPHTAADPGSYEVSSFTYKYHSTYGSPMIRTKASPIRAANVSEDGRSVRLVLDGGMRRYYIHEIEATGVRSRAGQPLLHEVGFYTLNNIPEASSASSKATSPVSPETTSSTSSPKDTKEEGAEE